MAMGHHLTIYSYEPGAISGVPAGVEVRDANEVMSDPRRTRLFDTAFRALGSDFFRYEVFAKGLGYWVDLDLLFLKPLEFDEPYVFGWESSKSINGAVLKLPQGSPMLHELRGIPEKNWCPPFFGPRRRAIYYWNRLRRGDVMLENLPWGVAGPAMLTYLARKYSLTHFAQSKSVFYPLDYADAQLIFEDAEIVEALIRPETRALHMWNSRLRGLVDQPPPQGSYIDTACRSYGIAYST